MAPSLLSTISAGMSPARMEQKRHDMGRNRSTAIIVAVGLLLSACSASTSPSPKPSSSQSFKAIALYFVGDTAQGMRLYREFHKGETADSSIANALNLLFRSKPLDPDYANLWPRDAKVTKVSTDADLATIDLSFSSLNVGAESEMRAIDQVVWTATAADTSIKRIELRRDGKKVETLAGHVDTRGTFTREATYEVLAPVWITSVQEGDSTTVPLTFGGVAQTFEANVEWQVLQGKKIVARGATTAEEAAPARTPWKVTVANLKPGSYTIRAFTSSAMDGSLVAEDTKSIELR